MNPLNSMPPQPENSKLGEIELAPGYSISMALYTNMSTDDQLSLKKGIDDMIHGRTVSHRQVIDELNHEFTRSNLVEPREKSIL
jgi:hypothetical protein